MMRENHSILAADEEILSNSSEDGISERISFPHLMQDFAMKYPIQNNKPHSYCRALQRLEDWCMENHLTIDQLEHKHINYYKEDIEERFTKETVALHMRAIRKFFDWLVEEKHFKNNPMPELITVPKKSVELISDGLLSLQEIIKLFNSFDKNRLVDLRIRAMMGLMLYACIPGSSIPKLKVEDYSFNKEKKYIQLQKSNQDHHISLHPLAVTFLDEYIKAAKLDGLYGHLLFPIMDSRGVLTQRILSKKRLEHLISKRGKGVPGGLTITRLNATGIVALLQSDSIIAADVFQLFGSSTVTKYQAVANASYANLAGLFDVPPSFNEKNDQSRSLFDGVIPSISSIRRPLQDFVEKSGMFRLDNNPKISS